MLAQAFGEYGALTSVIAWVERVAYSATDFMRATGPETWLVMGAVAAFMLWFMVRR